MNPLLIAAIIVTTFSGLSVSAPASAADQCCRVTKPLNDYYKSYVDEFACIEAETPAGSTTQVNCSCSNDRGPCEKSEVVITDEMRRNPWLCTLTMTNGSKRQDCVPDRAFCAHNVDLFGANNIANCSCADDAEKCPKVVIAADPIKPLPNPLGDGVTDIRVIVSRFIRIFTGISGSIALLMFVYGGFLWTTSAGNMDKVKQGQKVFATASIGLIIIFTAYVAVAAIFRVLAGAAL